MEDVCDIYQSIEGKIKGHRAKKLVTLATDPDNYLDDDYGFPEKQEQLSSPSATLSQQKQNLEGEISQHMQPEAPRVSN